MSGTESHPNVNPTRTSLPGLAERTGLESLPFGWLDRATPIELPGESRLSEKEKLVTFPEPPDPVAFNDSGSVHLGPLVPQPPPFILILSSSFTPGFRCSRRT